MSAKQFTTFVLGDYEYGIDVMRVQEVTNSLTVTRIPLAPAYVKGLINLRGQVATAIGLAELFGLAELQKTESHMTVVCTLDGNLLSLIVDSIGDVVEIPESQYEPTPHTVQGQIKNFMSGVYKTDGKILSIIDLDRLSNELNKSIEQQKEII